MSIPTVTLNDGNKAPILAFGTGTALYGQDSTPGVIQAIQTGYHHVDAAEAYANEENTGKAIATAGVPREQLFITSKGAIGKTSGVRASLEQSLKKLGISQLDLYLIHSPLDKNISETWAELEQAQKDGLVKSIGVSNYTVEHLEELLKTAKVVPAVNQIEFNPLLYAASKPLLDFAKAKGIVIAVYGPLTSLTKAKGSNVDHVAAEIAKSKGWTEAQVLLKFASQTTGGIIVTTSSKKERLEEQLKPFTEGPLSDDEINRLIEAGKSKHHRSFFPHFDKK